MASFDERLALYADLAIRVGVNLQKGQRLVVAAPLSSAPFVRQIVRRAYEAGAYDVHVEWGDDEVRKARLQHAPEEALVDIPAWAVQKQETLVEERAAFLNVFSPTPGLLQDVDPARIGKAMIAAQTAFKNFRQATMGMKVSWLIISPATQEWADAVYPDLEPAERVRRLWDDIFEMCRINADDPVGAWREHVESLTVRAQFLNQSDIRRLHYTAPGTNLTVDLPKGYRFRAGQSTNEAGTECVVNIPTEEVFTMPHRMGVNGVVRSTLPLNYQGITVEDIRLTFKDGEIVDYAAGKGFETLRSIIETDEGSRRLGEVALVAQDSPIARTGRLFYNTLFDENASCHLAIGQAYPECIADGDDMSAEDLLAAGANSSMTHVDFMVGSDELDVVAETSDGRHIPLLSKGLWAIR